MNEQRFDDIWDAIEPSAAEAASMRARSDLVIAIREIVDRWQVTQSDAADRLGVNERIFDDLINGRIDQFTLDALVSMAAQSGLAVRLEVVRPAA